MAVQLKVLGASGSVSIEAKPSSFILGEHILFDAGSAASTLERSKQHLIRSIFLTHAHLDHVKDLAFLAENVFSEIKQPIEIYAHSSVLATLAKHLFNGAIWPDFTKLPTAANPVFVFRPIDNMATVENCCGEPVSIQAIEVNHPGPTLGYLIRGERSSVLYTGDTGPTEKIWQLAAAAKVEHIFLETSFPNRLSALANEAKHLTPKMLQGELKKITHGGVKIYIYHMKIPYESEIKEEIESINDSRLSILKPGQTFDLGS